MTPAELAMRIGKTERWVKRNAYRLPHHKFGRSYYFDADDIAEILAAHRHRPDGGELIQALRPVGARKKAS